MNGGKKQRNAQCKEYGKRERKENTGLLEREGSRLIF